MKIKVLAIAGVCLSAALTVHSQQKTVGLDAPYSTVSAYGEYVDRAVRWAPGPITVSDQTGLLEKYPKILSVLGANLGKTHFQTVRWENQAALKIEWADDLPAPYQTSCAIASPKIDYQRSTIIAVTIRVKKDDNGCMESDEGVALLIHELGHALGFVNHAQDGIMHRHNPKGKDQYVDMETLQRFLTGLYSLEPGEQIPKGKIMPRPDLNTLVWDGQARDAASLSVLHAIATKDPKALGPLATSQLAYRAVEPESTVPAKAAQGKKLPESQVIPISELDRMERVEIKNADGSVTWEFHDKKVGGAKPVKGNKKARYMILPSK